MRKKQKMTRALKESALNESALNETTALSTKFERFTCFCVQTAKFMTTFYIYIFIYLCIYLSFSYTYYNTPILTPCSLCGKIRNLKEGSFSFSLSFVTALVCVVVLL